jgi:cysteinyl-tRNA synthetase
MITPEPKDFLHQILKIVLSDGKISKEERILVDNIARNIKQYDNAVQNALQDDILTKNEMNVLLNLYNEIIADAEFTANKDAYISQDEKNILDKLLEYLKKLSIKL